jgi:hypothetical protein
MRVHRTVGALLLSLSACAVSNVNEGQNPLTSCAKDTDCQSGLHCATGACQVLPRDCSQDAECDSGQRCRDTFCLPANLAFCQRCTTSADCQGGVCVQVVPGIQVCGQACGACPPGSPCQNVVGPSGEDAGTACVPTPQVCSAYDGGTSGFSYINHNLFRAVCTSCHAAGAGPTFGSLDLVTDPYHALLGPSGQGAPASNSLGSEMGLVRVKPGDPGNSLLYVTLVLLAYDPLYGNAMPPSPLPPNSPELVAAVRAWIAAGAPNN